MIYDETIRENNPEAFSRCGFMSARCRFNALIQCSIHFSSLFFRRLVIAAHQLQGQLIACLDQRMNDKIHSKLF